MEKTGGLTNVKVKQDATFGRGHGSSCSGSLLSRNDKWRYALGAVITLLTLKLATGAVAGYTLLAESIATYSVIEIGPNLLAAVTSIVGAAVLVVQLYLASRIGKASNTADEAKNTAELTAKIIGEKAKREPPL